MSSAVVAGLVALANSFGKTFGVHHTLGSESLALWFDVLTFFVSASIVAALALAHRPAAAGQGAMDLGRAFRDFKARFHFIKTSPVVRGVLICLTLGLAGKVFLIAASAVSELSQSSLLIGGFGVCTGAAYVLGFSILQSEVGDELRGRVFASLYSSPRLSLFLALVVAPIMTTVLDGVSRSVLGHGRRLSVAGVTVHLPGVRLALWLGGLIILGGGRIAARGLLPVSADGPGGPAEPVGPVVGRAG